MQFTIHSDMCASIDRHDETEAEQAVTELAKALRHLAVGESVIIKRTA